MTDVNEAAVVTKGLCRRFGDTAAVNGLTLEVRRGEVFGFLGHNGAGKTTTVRLLNGVLAPSAGCAQVLGLDPVLQGPALRRRTGVLTETPSLDERLTARDSLTIYADLYGVPLAEVKPRVEELLAAFDLAGRADEKVGAYSRGMKQRLALARALLHRPEVLFLDEPTSGLDPVAARQVHELIAHLSREEHRTVFLCTHNLAEAQALCDRVAVLRRGELLALGTPAELAQQARRTLVLDIEVGPAHVEQALAILREHLGPNGVDLAEQPGFIKVQGAGREQVPALLAALVGSGVPVYAATPQQPSLEDVYFALYGAKEGAL